MNVVANNGGLQIANVKFPPQQCLEASHQIQKNAKELTL
jgi:hypothetical protein